MRIGFFFRVAPKGISGGRYHAFMMAEALASKGHEVTIYTDNDSEMFNMLQSCDAHHTIVYYCIGLNEAFDFTDVPELCVLVPDMSGHPFFYDLWRQCKTDYGSKLLFLNFETPNWFNSLSPIPRDEKFWTLWKRYAGYADYILSSTKEGMRFAIEYYSQKPEQHGFCYPGIRSDLADKIGEVSKERQFLIFARFNWADHKGSLELDQLLDPRFKGVCLKLVCGQSRPNRELERKFEQSAEQAGMTIEYLDRIDDEEKFLEIRKSLAVLFPSYFEGFGYPPVESLYCGVPCVCFDLPVIKETLGSFPLTAKPGDWEGFRRNMFSVLEGDTFAIDRAKARAKQVSDFSIYSGRLDSLARQLVKQRKSLIKRLVERLLGNE